MPTQTSVYNLNKPTVSGDPDTWGGSTGLNGTIDKTEAALKATATTGSSNAYVLSSGLTLAAYATGLTLRIIPNFTNSGAATINVDGLGAKNVTKLGATAVASGDITSGRIYTLGYDGTQFQIVEINAIDPTLATIAALTPTTDQFIYFTGTDTAATTGITSSGRTALAGATAAGSSMMTAASAAAQTALLNAFTGDSGSGGVKGMVPAPSSGDASKFLKGDGTWAVGGGAWGSPIASWTYSTGVTQVDFTGLSAYTELLVIAHNIQWSGGDDLAVRWSTDNGSTFIATNYESGPSSTMAQMSAGAAFTKGRGVMHILNWNSASQNTNAIPLGSASAGGSLTPIIDSTVRAKNALRVLAVAGSTFTAGFIRIYGKA